MPCTFFFYFEWLCLCKILHACTVMQSKECESCSQTMWMPCKCTALITLKREWKSAVLKLSLIVIKRNQPQFKLLIKSFHNSINNFLWWQASTALSLLAFFPGVPNFIGENYWWTMENIRIVHWCWIEHQLFYLRVQSAHSLLRMAHWSYSTLHHTIGLFPLPPDLSIPTSYPSISFIWNKIGLYDFMNRYLI